MYGDLGDQDACIAWWQHWVVVSIGVPAGLSDTLHPAILGYWPHIQETHVTVAPSWTSTRCLLYLFAGEELVHAGVPQGDWSPCCFLEL